MIHLLGDRHAVTAHCQRLGSVVGPDGGAPWRGMNCGCLLDLRPGCLNTDWIDIRGPKDTDSNEGVVVRLPGDVYYLCHDARSRYPLADASLDWIFSEHMIEHLTPEAAVAWLREMRRLLRPGGVLRVSTPDLERYVAAYVTDDRAFFEAVCAMLRRHGCVDADPRPAWVINQVFHHWGHQWIYDFAELRRAGVEAGFPPAGILKAGYRTGGAAALAGMDKASRAVESLYAVFTA